jgi:hypothetical protein
VTAPLEPAVQVGRLTGRLDPARGLVELIYEERLAADPTARWEPRGELRFPAATVGDAISILRELQGARTPEPTPAPAPQLLTASDRDLLERAGLRFPR